MYKNHEKIKDEWNAESDEYFKSVASGHEIKIVINDPSRAFPEEVFEMIAKHFPNLKGKKVLVPSSGDNMAVFAFSLLGADVTSLDIAERQLFNAKQISDMYGFENIEYIVDDSMYLNNIKDNIYDLVYTSNSVHTWIYDITCMYKNFHRVLRKNGKYIMFETHPIIRAVDEKDNKIIALRPYEKFKPRYWNENDAPCYYWRIQDKLNALIESKFTLLRVEEFHVSRKALNNFNTWRYGSSEEAEADNYQKYDWKVNEFAVLPEWLGLCAEKQTRNT